MRAVVALGCAAALAACAAGKSKSAAPSPAMSEAEPSGAAVMPASQRDQILDLEAQIDAARAQLALADPGDGPLPGVSTQPMGVQPHSANPACRPAPSETCKSSCTLSDSICDNADKICRIAQDLVGDSWAQNKCAKANQLCEASRTKCCGCV